MPRHCPDCDEPKSPLSDECPSCGWEYVDDDDMIELKWKNEAGLDCYEFCHSDEVEEMIEMLSADGATAFSTRRISPPAPKPSG